MKTRDGATAVADAAAGDFGGLPFKTGSASATGSPAIDELVELARGDRRIEHLLAQLAADGRLYQADASGRTLAEEVAGYLKADGGNVADARVVLEQLADPGLIRQVRGKDTCLACQGQYNWAVNAPGDYFRAATGLLRDGETGGQGGLKVDAGGTDNRRWIKNRNWPANDKLNATMQAALTNRAFTSEGSYNIENDKLGRKNHRHQSGVALDEAQAFMEGLTGAALDVATTPQEALDLLSHAIAVVQAGGTVPAVLRAPEGGDTPMHLVTITAFGDEGVTYMDGAGGMQTCSVEDFLALLQLDPASLDGTVGTGSTTVATGGTGNRTR